MAVRRAGLGLLFLLCVPGLVLAQRIDPFTAHYQVRFHGLTLGEGNIELAYPQNGLYRLRSELINQGLAALLVNSYIEQVNGRLDPEGLRPQHYRLQRSGLDMRSLELNFDWTARRVDSLEDQHATTLSLDEVAIDPLSLLLQAMQDLSAQTPRDSYLVVDGDKLERWQVNFIGEVRLKTPYGSIDTMHYEHAPPNSQRRIGLWLAPELDYLLVRFARSKRGRESLSLTLSRLERRP